MFSGRHCGLGGKPDPAFQAGHLRNNRSLRGNFDKGAELLRVTCRAKRLECVELAPAFGLTAPFDSASKLVELHTLRAAHKNSLAMVGSRQYTWN